MKLSKQLSVITLVATFGLIILGAVTLQTLRTNLLSSGEDQIKTILSLAKQQASYYIELEQQNKMTREEAEEKVVEVLSNMRFGLSYIWGNDNNSISRIHPKPTVVGKPQETYQRDFNALQNLDFIINKGEYPKPGTEGLVTKINGAVKLPKWDWVIGYGIYMDDVNKKYFDSAVSFIIIALVILALIITTAIYITKNIIRNIGGEPSYALTVTTRIADGYLNEEIEGTFTQNSFY